MDFREFFIQTFLVVLRTADLQHTFGFVFVFDRFVEVFEDRQRGFFEFRSPVERAALCGGRTVREHPVHSVFIDEADQALGELFNRFVERFGRAVTVLAKNVVLRFHNTREATHQDATLPDEVGGHFFFEGGREEIARADTDTESHTAFFGVAGRVLMNRKAGVDARAAEEVAANVEAGTFRSNEDYIHVFRRNDFGEIVINDRETVAEVEGVARIQIAFDLRPADFLRSIRQEVLNNGTLLNGFFDFEERFARHKAVFFRAVPVLHELFGLPHNNVEAIVAQVQRLGRTLYTIPDDRDGFFFENLAGFRQREFFTSDDGFFCSAKINNCHDLSP